MVCVIAISSMIYLMLIDSRETRAWVWTTKKVATMAPPPLLTLALPNTQSPPSTQSARTSMRNRTPFLIAIHNAKQEVAVKEVKEDQAARHDESEDEVCGKVD